MTDMPDLEMTPDDFEPPTDPMTLSYEDWQESDEYRAAIEAVKGQKVDDVDAGPFLTRDITLQEVVGEDAATDVAAEGLIHGFEAGFRYGARGGKALDDRIAEIAEAHYRTYIVTSEHSPSGYHPAWENLRGHERVTLIERMRMAITGEES